MPTLEALVSRWRERRMIPLNLAAFGERPMRLNLSDATMASIQEVTAFEALNEPGIPPISDDEALDYRLRSLIEEAFASSKIEGAVTSRRIASDLARGKREPRGHSERMVLNNWEALRHLDEWQAEPLTVSRLCEIQALVTKGTDLDPADVGHLRTDDDVVVEDALTHEVVHHPPPAADLPARLERLLRFANEDQGLPHLAKAILVHHQLAFEHPFADGNGRTARVVFLLEASRHPDLRWISFIPISRSIAERKEAYYQAFRDTADEGWDTTHFLRQQLRCLSIECERMAGFLKDFARRRALYSQKLELEGKLNGRQVALIRSALKRPETRFTQVEHARHHQVTTMTAQRDLQQLVDWKLLGKRRDPKDLRRYLYRPTARLLELGDE